MLHIGFTEVGIVVVILLLVLGPKRLPKALAFLKKNIRRLRGLRSDIKHTVEDVLHSTEEAEAQLEPEQKVAQPSSTESPEK